MSSIDPVNAGIVPLETLTGMGNPVLNVSDPSEYNQMRSDHGRTETIRLSDLANTTRDRFGDGDYLAQVFNTDTDQEDLEQALATAVLFCFSPAASRGIIVTPA